MLPLPTMTRRLGALLGAALLLASPTTTSAAAASDPLVPASGLRVTPPPPGYGIAISALTIDGSQLDLVVETDAHGRTRIIDDGAVVESPAAGGTADALASSPRPCRDGKYSLLGYRWSTTLSWWFDAGSTPPEITLAATESHLKAAIRSITGARNSCGLPDRISARSSYRGRTATHAKVRGDGSCGSSDGKSVVGFGNLPGGVAGLTCTIYFRPRSGVGRAFEMDMLLNKQFAIWSTSPSSCSGPTTLIVRSVATHEFGHAFGLGHVSEQDHGQLTMSTQIAACEDSAFTLGLGDIRGLEKRY